MARKPSKIKKSISDVGTILVDKGIALVISII